MAGMNVPVSILGGGIAVVPLKEYDEWAKEHRYLMEKVAAADNLIREMSGEIEQLRQGRTEECEARRTSQQEALVFYNRVKTDMDFINSLANDICTDSGNEEVKASAREIMERCKRYLQKGGAE